MFILVTRPKDQGFATARALRTLGHRSVIDPMLRIRAIYPDEPEPDDIAAILMTSSNGVLGLRHHYVDLPVFAVGEATASAARNHGCRNVHVADGDGRSLARLVVDRLDRPSGALVHLAGFDVRDGLEETLLEAGLDYQKRVVYTADPAARFGNRTIRALEYREFDAVLFYSPRTATIFADLADEAGLIDCLSGVTAVCLSDAVAEQIDDLPWNDLKVSPRRDQKALLGCLEPAMQS